MGAGKAIQSDLAQKKAMEVIKPLVGDTLEKLGDKVGGEEMKQLGLIPGLMKQLGAGAGGKKRKRRMPITASSIPSTLQRLFRCQGRRNVGVLPETISGPQVGMGLRSRCRQPSSHCFQGLP